MRIIQRYAGATIARSMRSMGASWRITYTLGLNSIRYAVSVNGIWKLVSKKVVTVPATAPDPGATARARLPAMPCTGTWAIRL